MTTTKTLEEVLKECSKDYNKDLNNYVSNKEKESRFTQKERLKKLGFNSSLGVTMFSNGQNLEFLNTVKNVHEIIAFIQETKECFGENTIIIKRSDFESIVKKYNLQCGLFKDYTGIVPDENLTEIENVYSKIEKFYEYRLEKNAPFVAKYKRLREAFIIMQRGSFKEKRLLYKVDQLSISLRNYIKFHKALDTFLRIPFIYDVDLGFNYIVNKQFGLEGFGESLLIEDRSYPYNLFICAPRHEMLNVPKVTRLTVNRKKEEDPFICSLCEFGVIIYSMWGKEAADETLNKYKSFLKK